MFEYRVLENDSSLFENIRSLFVFSWFEFYKSITGTSIFVLSPVFKGKESSEN